MNRFGIVVCGAAALAAVAVGASPAAASVAVHPGGAASSQTAVLPAATASPALKAQLTYWVQEEKLAYDLYTALAAKYPGHPQFSAIAKSEAQHMAAVRRLMSTYGVKDPTAGAAAGVFTNRDLAALYSRLLSSATTPAAALAAGATVERKDIADLTAALAKAVPADVRQVINSQLAASRNHLRAFTR